MCSYTFYPSCPNGAVPVFEEAELSNDAEAIAYAQGVLQRHRSSVVVDIWDGDRDVETVRRRDTIDRSRASSDFGRTL